MFDADEAYLTQAQRKHTRSRRTKEGEKDELDSKKSRAGAEKQGLDRTNPQEERHVVSETIQIDLTHDAVAWSGISPIEEL